MSIQVGDRIPSVGLKRVTAQGIDDVQTDALFKGRKVVLFSVPGAFTPTCSNMHLPGYVARAADIKSKGVVEIVCLAVNDHHVMKAWAEQHQALGVVTMLADGNGDFTRALGMESDLRGAGLGMRGKRFAMVVEDGVVKSVEIEAKAGSVELSGAEACLARL